MFRKLKVCLWFLLSNIVLTFSDQIYHSFEVLSISPMTHNTFIYTLKAPEGLHFPVPLGHHCLMRLPSSLVNKPFTPISYVNATCKEVTQPELKFFIKIYENGVFSKDLSTVVEGKYCVFLAS